jgi:hypothetical protein
LLWLRVIITLVCKLLAKLIFSETKTSRAGRG